MSNKSNDYKQIITTNIQYLYALHLGGERAAALSVLEQVDEIRTQEPLKDEWVLNFRISELLLADAERISWLKVMKVPVKILQLEAARKAIGEARRRFEPLIHAINESEMDVISCGCLKLIQGRISLYAAQCFTGNDAHNERSKARNYLEDAFKILSPVGHGFIPIVLIALAWSRKLDNEEVAACADLDRAWESAERGYMNIHMADILLYRARLFFRRNPYPWVSSPCTDIVEARKLIEQCGYWRHKEELEDVKTLIMS